MASTKSMYSILCIASIAICTILKADASQGDHNVDIFDKEHVTLKYNIGSGYSLPVRIGNQELDLKLVSHFNGIVLFERGTNACSFPLEELKCYAPLDSKTATWCNNNDACLPGKNGYICDEVPSHESIVAATVTPFIMDGTMHKMETLEGFEEVKIQNEGLIKDIVLQKHPVKMTNRIVWSSPMSIPSQIGGFFGLAGSSTSCRDKNLWTHVLSRYDGSYVLDLNGAKPDKSNASFFKSKIHFSLDNVKDSLVMWSEKRQTGGIFTDASLGFTVYDMSMCGVNLFGRTSTYWVAEIDLSSQCLVLPKNFWLSLMSQLPVIETCYSNDSAKKCKLNREGITHLPTIEFKLSQSDSFQVLRIPLQNLLLDDSSTPELCILPDETVETSSFADNPTIKFGYRVLESLTVAVDTRKNKLGFVHKDKVVSTNSICAAPPTCVGDQIYIPELNFCMQPICNIWFFKTLDEVNGRCVTISIAKASVIIFFAGLLIMEGRRYIFRKKLFDTASKLS